MKHKNVGKSITNSLFLPVPSDLHLLHPDTGRKRLTPTPRQMVPDGDCHTRTKRSHICALSEDKLAFIGHVRSGDPPRGDPFFTYAF